MKLLTLNTHSLAEKHADEKREIFAEMIAQELPDVFALQEVNQRIEEDPVLMDGNPQYIPCRGFSGPVRRRNHALSLAELLKEKNCPYFWTWVPAMESMRKDFPCSPALPSNRPSSFLSAGIRIFPTGEQGKAWA